MTVGVGGHPGPLRRNRVTTTQTTNIPGRWCLGHGVAGQAESLRHGHYVEGYLVQECFSTHATRGKTLAPQLEPRCAICRSIRRWHDHHLNAYRRANAFRRGHAQRWVDKGIHPTIEAALQEMDIGGCTVEAIAQLILAALDEPCPGLCAHEDDGQIIFHTINSVADLHVDVKDPAQPFTIENIGILCHSCNEAKRGTPWAVFIYRRRCHLRMWQAAINRPAFRRSHQMRLDLT